MRPLNTTTAILLLSVSVPAHAQEASGDVEAGEKLFKQQCVVCHVVSDDDGALLAGRGAGSGPNLYGVIGEAPGTRHDFAYSASLQAYGETGITWEEDNIISFMQGPTEHLRQALDDSRARSKMAFKLRDADAGADVYAYLAQFSTSEEAASPDENTQNPDAAAVEESSEDAQALAATDLAAGQSIYQQSCRNCHGPKAQGMASFPQLAGKDAEYLQSRLQQYRAKEPVGPNSPIMYPVARELSDEDIANIAGFIASIE